MTKASAMTSPIPASVFPTWRGFLLRQGAGISFGDRQHEAYKRRPTRYRREHIYFHVTGGFPCNIAVFVIRLSK